MIGRWKDIYQRLTDSRRSRFALHVLFIMIFLALFGDFIANEKPLYCVIDGEHFFPVGRGILVSAGLSNWPAGPGDNWKEGRYERVLWAPVPYSPGELDLRNANFKGPFDNQNVSGVQFRHWLGTDKIGRDVLAGMIRGCRIALAVGCLSMLLACLLGIPLGAVAGYFGDHRLQLPWQLVLAATVIAFLATFYFWFGISYLHTGARQGWILLLLAFFLCAAGAWLIWLKPGNKGRVKRWAVPCDNLVMRSVEVIRSIPAFFLLFAVLGIIDKPSWIYVVLIIGVLRIPTIVRYVRAEVLRIRDQTYIDAARVIGLSDARILRRHVIPGSLGPVFVTIAFGIGGAVLLESGLSFLGIGLSIDQVSWGKILSAARDNFSAWWLAVFPGLAIFVTIAVFNVLGDALADILDVRTRRV